MILNLPFGSLLSDRIQTRMAAATLNCLPIYTPQIENRHSYEP